MCGIAGFVNFDSQKPSLSLLKTITDAIAYRGPDDEGQEVINQCALGNRRLAIIDTSFRAHQPMHDKEKRFYLTFNGEIYNFKELRENLQEKGYRFFSDSDTEVLLYSYKEWGVDCLKKLRGIFALAIWDKKREELLLARDHFGVKPLHYYLNEKVFIFSSEIKSILLHPQVKKNLNLEALSSYFSLGFGCVASPQTIFQNIFKLPAGHYAILRKNRLLVRSYWDLSKIKPQNISFDQAVGETRRLLEKSVKSQLVSDVPLGVFLSGGVDSSLLAALSQRNSAGKVETFSIGFKEPEFDETKYARQAASYLKTNHYHQYFTREDLLKTLFKVVEKMDEPLADASILPTYLLSGFARKTVKVCLSGDGGDELFAGYPTYIASKAASPLRNLPGPVITALKKIALTARPILSDFPLLAHSPNLPANFKIERFFNGLNRNFARQYLDFLGPMRLADKSALLLNNQESALSFVEKLVEKVSRLDPVSKAQFLDLMIFLPDDLLVKTDRASSYNSLEVRVPFLDVDLAEFIFSLPSDYKLHRLTLKYLLKKAASGLIPSSIIDRPKKGFGVPTNHWLNQELKGLLKAKLGRKRLLRQGLFNPDYVSRLIAEHQEEIVDHRMVLWNLLIFQLWSDRWLA